MRNACAKLKDRTLEMLADQSSISAGPRGRGNIEKHPAELSLAYTVQTHFALFQAGLKERDFAKKPMDKMLWNEAIELTRTECAASIFLASKKAAFSRSSVCYRKLNACTRWDVYLRRRMDECIDHLGEVAVFSTLHANSMSWPVEIKMKHQEMAAFSSKWNFLTTTIDHFGLAICAGNLEIASHSMDASRAVSISRYATALKSFLGLCIVFRRFVFHFSKAASPFSRKLLKSEGWSLILNKRSAKQRGSYMCNYAHLR